MLLHCSVNDILLLGFLYFFAKLSNLFQTANKVSLFHRISRFFITKLRTFAATMKFVIDDRIPYIREAVARMDVEAVYKEGKASRPVT